MAKNDDAEVRFNLRMKVSLLDELKVIEQETGRTVADIIRQLADEYVQGRKNGGKREWVTAGRTS